MNRFACAVVVTVLVGIIAGGIGCQPQAKVLPPAEPLQPPPLPPVVEQSPFPLAQATRLPMPARLSLDKLAAEWPDFKHEPFDVAGFNHVTLPFRYESRAGGGDPNEALAFSFLLSNTLDWAPGCYCARHAYFAFKADAGVMKPLATRYDLGPIARMIKEWDATHAIGGVVRQEAQGYSGTLEVYGPRGLLHSVEYGQPRDYFTLLGDMAVDALRYFDYTPSPALIEHLHKPRCKDFRSIRNLGAAAFLPARCEVEFGIYRWILEHDPGFAEVRYWYANQKQWGDGDRKTYFLEMARSLEDYVFEATLADFDPKKCPDAALAAQFETRLAEGERLVGKDSPILLHRRLALATGPVPEETLRLATEVAARYPNHYWFLYELGRAYEKQDDPDMAASINLAALQNRYLVGIGSKRHVQANLARCLSNLGLDGEAYACILPVFKEDMSNENLRPAAWASRYAAHSLANAGWYEKSIGAYERAWRGAGEKDDWRDEMLLRVVASAGIAGRQDVLTQFLRDHREDLDRTKITFLAEAYLQVLKGETVDADAVVKQAPKGEYYTGIQTTIFVAQVDLMKGHSRHRKRVVEALTQQPDLRPLWILFDLYDRQEPRPDSAAFYRMIEWLHGDDPWVQQAVANYKRRAAEAVLPAAGDLLAKLQDFSPERWPAAKKESAKKAKEFAMTSPVGAVPAALRALLDKGDFKTAEDLALRYHHSAVDRTNFHLASHANWLIRLVERARAAH